MVSILNTINQRTVNALKEKVEREEEEEDEGQNKERVNGRPLLKDRMKWRNNLFTLCGGCQTCSLAKLGRLTPARNESD